MPEALGIHYQKHGDGGAQAGVPPLVLIHGAGGNHLYWPPEIRRWAGAPTYSLDLVGHGESSGQSQSTLSGYAERLLDWLREMELPPVVLMGHSMGGAISLTMALRSPRQLAGLVLVSSSARLRVAAPILNLSSSRETFEEAVDLVIEAAFSPQTSTRLITLARDRMLEAGHVAFHNDFKACDNFDVRTRLKEIPLPALVISGQDDQLTPPKLGQELADGLSTARFEMVPAAGHMVMLEQPAIVQKAVESFYLEQFG